MSVFARRPAARVESIAPAPLAESLAPAARIEPTTTATTTTAAMMTGAGLQLTTTSLTSNEFALTNCAYVHPLDQGRLAELAKVSLDAIKDKGLICVVGEAVFFVKAHDSFKPGSLGVGMMQRVAAALTMNSIVLVTPFLPPISGPFFIATIQLEIDLVRNDGKEVTIEAPDLVKHLQRTFGNHVFKVGQSFATDFSEKHVNLKAVVKGFDFEDAGSGDTAAPSGAKFGLFSRTTEVELRKSASSALKLVGASKTKGNQLFAKGFNFEALGIGGLNKEFADIFRRAFSSRTIPPDILRKMGQHHVRGMLLYGPPGCGKTLIARQIGKALQAHPPKIVNGPEILNKFVGQSEENIRKLFEDAEKEQAERGDDSELHIIIFDEFDAICRQRGSTGGGTGVNDSIVNQLLSKIDGVDALNNILLIGMTNRKDMIDEAILRPGRLEVHVEIGLPDEEGRLQILNIHTGDMRKAGLFAPDISLPELAARTKNYTGAEIEGLVKAACSYVFERQTDLTDLSKKHDWKGVQVTAEDFERALRDVQPAFGVKEDELTRCFANGIVPHGDEYERVRVTMERIISQVANSDRSPLLSVLLTGPSGCGKTALAAKMAVESGFPFVKRVSAQSLLNHHESGKADAIAKVFNDAYKSPLSLIILDDIERLMEYAAIGPRFSNVVLQTLLVLTKALPPKDRRLLILATSAKPELLSQLELESAFQLVLSVPLLTEEAQFATVLRSAARMSAPDVESVSRALAGHEIGIKKMLMMIETARQEQPDDVISEERFMEVMAEWGV